MLAHMNCNWVYVVNFLVSTFLNHISHALALNDFDSMAHISCCYTNKLLSLFKWLKNPEKDTFLTTSCQQQALLVPHIVDV